MKVRTILAVPLVLAACQSPEVVSICAARGDPAAQITAVLHDAGGRLAVLASDTATGDIRITEDAFKQPILTRLWRVAEVTMRTLPDVDPSPCGFSTRVAVMVVFADGTRLYRQTSCTGNALSRVNDAVFKAAETSTPAPARAPLAMTLPLAGLAEACEALE
ncbi:MAG: hypothetical protein GDA52_05905 [Rhodobacteraceae bacterium]|nr:hypothetical protein [Paracoccaceae bacterium]